MSTSLPAAGFVVLAEAVPPEPVVMESRRLFVSS